MRTLVKIYDYTGYVDIPVEDGQPNPYTSPYANHRGKFFLDMEILESIDFPVGHMLKVVFTRGAVELLENS
jgi:hypothetical protein